MDNNEVLGHLLEVESKAALLVDEAQAEADRRVTEAEKQNRAAYDERYRAESERLEKESTGAKDSARQRFREELETYKKQVSSVRVDAGRFSALLDSYISAVGGK